MKLHIAREEDTIISLSDKYGVSPDRILEMNPQIAETGKVGKGAKVKIPSGPVSMLNMQRAEEQPNEPMVAAAQVNVQAQPVAEENVPEAVEAAEVEAHAEAPQPNEQAMPNATAPAVSYLYASGTEKKAAPMYPLGMQETDYPNMVNPYAGYGGAPSQGTAPTHYKTEPAEGNPSPLYVKWKGMNDDNAVHPFAQTPTPAIPAGAMVPPAPFQHTQSYQAAEPNAAPEPFVPQYPMGAYGTGAGANAAPGTFGVHAHGPFGPAHGGPFGIPAHGPGPFGVPMAMPMPGAFGGPMPIPGAFGGPMPMAGPFGAPAGDCGCGGPAAQLPYALPKRYDEQLAQQQDASRADISSVPGTESSEELAQPAAAAKSKPAKKKVKVTSRSDSLRSLLKKAKRNQKQQRRGSTPWVND